MKYAYVGNRGGSDVFRHATDAYHRWGKIGRVTAINARRERRRMVNDGWQARLAEYPGIVGEGKTRDQAVDDVYKQVSGEIPVAADRQPLERRAPLGQLRREIAAWAAETFPDQTNARVAKHLQEEIDELDQALLEGKGIDVEIADSLILTLCMTQRLLDLAAGYDIDVKAAVDAKMEINRGRRWAFDPAFGYDKKIEGAA